MITLGEFIQIMQPCQAYYNKSLNDSKMSFYYQQLSSFDDKMLKMALVDIQSNETFFPKPAQIKKACERAREVLIRERQQQINQVSPLQETFERSVSTPQGREASTFILDHILSKKHSITYYKRAISHCEDMADKYSEHRDHWLESKDYFKKRMVKFEEENFDKLNDPEI